MDKDTRPHIKPGAIKYTKGFGIRLAVNKIVRIIVILIAIAMLSGTVYVYLTEPIKTEQGYINVEVKHGSHEVGEKVLVIESNVSEMFAPLTRALITQKPERMEIIAGPYGEIKKGSEEGKFKAIYGSNTSRVNLDISEGRYLDNEYVVRLLDSNNKHDLSEYDIIVDKSSIAGLLESSEEKESIKINDEDFYREPASENKTNGFKSKFKKNKTNIEDGS